MGMEETVAAARVEVAKAAAREVAVRGPTRKLWGGSLSLSLHPEELRSEKCERAERPPAERGEISSVPSTNGVSANSERSAMWVSMTRADSAPLDARERAPSVRRLAE